LSPPWCATHRGGFEMSHWVTQRPERSALLSLVLAGALHAIAHPALAADPPAASKLTWTRSAKSGPWSAPATWEGGKVPTALARVQVRTGHTVTYDVQSDQVIRAIHIAGTLRFATDRDTRLDVGLIKIQAGETASEDGFECDAHLPAPKPGQSRAVLEVGTPEAPVPASHRAVIRLVYVNGMDRETCPAIVCCGGRMDFHGAPMSRTWVKLGATVKQDAIVTLAEPVTGWRKGDRVIVTATTRSYRSSGPLTEERFIKAIDGTRLTLEQALSGEHLGEGEYRGEV